VQAPACWCRKTSPRLHHKLKQRMGKCASATRSTSALIWGRSWIRPVETVDSWVKTGLSEGGNVFQPEIQCPPGTVLQATLITGLDPAAATVQEEIFGPVLVSLTFRTPAEAVELANKTRYGLAASVWSDNINLALDAASKIKAGSVWVNCTNLFDGASGFGGYRERVLGAKAAGKACSNTYARAG